MTREELIKKLNNKSLYEIADFIIKDKERIVEPAQEAIRFWTNVGNRHCDDKKMINALVQGLENTLRFAGVEK